MRRTSPRRLLLAALLVFGSAFVAAPTSAAAQTDPAGDTAPPDTSPPETSPPDTSPPETSPPDTESPSSPDSTDAPDDSGDSNDDDADIVPILIVAGIGAVLIALLAGVWGAAKRRSHRTGDFRSRMAGARSRAQWLHDSLSVELSNRALDSQPQMLQQAWADGQRHVTDLTAELHGIAAQTSGNRHRTAVQSLISAVDALGGALATDVSLRSSGPTDDQVQLSQRAESTQTVAVRRAELANAIAATRSLAT